MMSRCPLLRGPVARRRAGCRSVSRMARSLFLFLPLLAPAVAQADSPLFRTLTLADYNTRIVVLGTAMFGLAAGLTGSFLVLRKRALLSDAIAHATLPGVVAAFLASVALGGSGKSLPLLLAGAALAGALGLGVVTAVQRTTRLRDDAALGIVLSVFFGLGVALLGTATRLPGTNAAGLNGFIYGKAASMLQADAIVLGIAAALALGSTVLLYKEWKLLCFDAPFAAVQGWPTLALDALLLALVLGITVAGLQAVGLLLVVAMLVIPPAAARFWTSRLRSTILLAGAFGMASGAVGAMASALFSDLPAGAVIVLAGAGVFLASLLFGREAGFARRAYRRIRQSRRTADEHLLRALWEIAESANDPVVDERALLAHRSWSPSALARSLRRAEREHLVARAGESTVRLTETGLAKARRLVRNHRLWELYLIHHAELAPSRVDWHADRIEHVLDPAMIDRLESLLADDPARALPASPHAVRETPA